MADGGYVGETIAKVGESVVTKGGSGNYWAIVKSNGLIFIKKSFKTKEEAIKFLKESDKMADGGKVKFADKVKSVQESLLKRKKVSPKVQKDYGKTYSKEEAKESAQRIVGSRMAQLKEKMAKKKK
jgi:hypothetical protein